MSSANKNAVTTGLAEQAQPICFILETELQAAVTMYDALSGARLIEPAVPGATTGVLPPEVLKQCCSTRRPVSTNLVNTYQLVIPLLEGGETRLIAVACVPCLARTHEEMLHESHRLERFCSLLAEKLASPARSPARTSGARELQACTALTAVDALLRSGLQGDRPVFQRRILKAVAEVLGVETVIWSPSQAGENVVIRGKHELSAWNCRQLAGALAHRSDWDGTGVLIDNDVEHSLLAELVPGVTGLLALKISDDDASGCLVALNKQFRPAGDKTTEAAAMPDVQPRSAAFRRSDAAFLAPFATLLATQSATSRRNSELKDLIVGFARSLTSAIDAKDPYTSGHSERVARIAVELSKELGLTDAETKDIYLAGLLHDIGKIGIRDDVLGKQGMLTDAEREHVAQHPLIGYRILSGLSAIKHLLGGVLYHHEQIDGRGYPEGLMGNKIPQNARIIAVADSFDAMSTDRPYRAGMPLEKVEQTFREGAGKQWDPDVVEAFHRCKEKIGLIRQQGLGESLRAALHGAIQKPLPDYQGSFVVPKPDSTFHRPA